MARIYSIIFCLLSSLHLMGQSFANAREVPDIPEEIQITSIAIDDDNNKYVGTEQGLFRISDNGLVESIMSSVKVHAIAWHKREGLWIGINSNRIHHPETDFTIELEKNISISSMAMSGSQLWVGTNQGIYVISPKRGEITDHYTAENSKLESSAVNVIYVDESGIKWVGTDAGIARIVNDKWKVYEKQAKITAITGNIEGVWIASDEEMWLVDPYNRWTPTGVEDGLSEGNVRALAADQKGKIYILSQKFIQFDPYNDRITEMDNDYAANAGSQVALLCDLDDNLWVGALDHGLVTLELEPSEQEDLEVFVKVQHPRCAGDRNGSMTIHADGGVPPYTYLWSDPSLEGQRQPEGLGAGDYALTVTDVSNQEYVIDVQLQDPMSLTVDIDQVQAISYEGMADGILMADANGGTGDFTYRWSDGSADRTLTDASPGTLSVLVTDSEGCTARAVYELQDGPPLSPPAEESEPKTEPEQDDEIAVAQQPLQEPPGPADIEDEPAKEPIEDESVSESLTNTTTDVVTDTVTDDSPAIAEEDEPVQEEEQSIEVVDKEVLRTLDAKVLARGQTLRIEQLYFDADSSDIRPESYEVLDEVYQFLENNRRIVIEIGGHTNGLPDHQYCDRLSTARAKSVADYLYQKGIPENRILYKGYGKRQPIATNETVIGRRKNQRVEIKILEI